MRLGGRSFKLVYNAEFALTEVSASRRQVARNIRDIARKHGCRWLLRFVYDTHELWDLSPQDGVSFSRQITYLLMVGESEEAQTLKQEHKAILVVPFDENVYVAHLEDGMVEKEQVLIASAAVDVLQEAENSAVKMYYIDQGGATQAELLHLSQATALADFPLSMQGKQDGMNFRFALLPVAMLRHRLYHPTQVMATVPLLLILVFGSFAYLNYREQIEDAVAFAARQAELQRQEDELKRELLLERNEASYAASSNLHDFLGLLKISYTLVGDGVERLRWQRDGMVILGATSSDFPAQAAAIGDMGTWNFRLATNGWELINSTQAATDKRDLTGQGTAIRKEIYQLAQMVGARLSINRVNTDIPGYEEIDFVLVIPTGIVAAIEMLANATVNRPYQLTSMNCEFSGALLAGCQAALTAKYIVEG